MPKIDPKDTVTIPGAVVSGLIVDDGAGTVVVVVVGAVVGPTVESVEQDTPLSTTTATSQGIRLTRQAYASSLRRRHPDTGRNPFDPFTNLQLGTIPTRGP
jgi:hypothetical protein